jgi:hypothetical protein
LPGYRFHFSSCLRFSDLSPLPPTKFRTLMTWVSGIRIDKPISAHRSRCRPNFLLESLGMVIQRYLEDRNFFDIVSIIPVSLNICSCTEVALPAKGQITGEVLS